MRDVLELLSCGKIDVFCSIVSSLIYNSCVDLLHSDSLWKFE